MGLPSLDIGAGILRDCYAPAMHWADVFWLTCLSKWVTIAGGHNPKFLLFWLPYITHAYH